MLPPKLELPPCVIYVNIAYAVLFMSTPLCSLNLSSSIAISYWFFTLFAKLNFVLTTYYKGTGIEGTTKKLEEYLLQERYI